MSDDKWEPTRLVELLYHSPALSFQLLAAVPGEAHHDTLKRALAAAVRLVGEQLIRIWVEETAHNAEATSAALLNLNRHSRRTAALASALAQASGLADEEHAWCAGLWHNLGQAIRAARYPGYPGPVVDERESRLALGESQRYGEDHAAVLARLAGSILKQPLLAEAIELHHASFGFVAAMPGLPRVLYAAVNLLAHGEQSIALAAQLLAMPNEQVAAAVAKAGSPLLAEANDYDPSAQTRRRRLDQPLLRSLLQGGFTEAPPEKFAARFQAAFRLLSQTRALIVLRQERERLIIDEAMPVAAPIDIPELDAQSVCRNALNNGLVQHSTTVRPSAADWLIARRLKVAEFDCLPWDSDDECGLILVEPVPEEDAAVSGRELQLAGLIGQAAMRVIKRLQAQRSRLEQAVAHARSSEATAARRVAHEISNPLTAIGNYLAVIENDTAMTPATQKMLRQLQAEIRRTQRLLVSLGRSETVGDEAEACNPNEVLLEISALYHDSLRVHHNIALNLKLAEAAPLVSISADALKQILINLTQNAAEAIGSDGVIKLRSSADINFNGLPWFEIRVEDNGPGFARTGFALELPSSTTKSGGHSGAGLAVCRSLVSKAQGHLICRSRPQKGTCFSLLLRPWQSEIE